MKGTVPNYGLVRRSPVTDEITAVMSGTSLSSLHVWALRNTERQKVIIFEVDSGLILNRYTDQNTADGFPHVEFIAKHGEYIDESIKKSFLSGPNLK